MRDMEDMTNDARDQADRVRSATEPTAAQATDSPEARWGMHANLLPVDGGHDALERCRALGVSPARLRFYRWLVRTGRLHD
jgi:hypothetical protein